MSRPSAAGLIVAIVLAVVASAMAFSFWGFSYDDAFINYRYARSVAEIGRLSYNPGEAVLGTTAPGWALLLGLACRLTRLSIPAIGTLIGLGSLLAVAGLVRSELREAPPFLREGLPLLFGLGALLSRWNVEMLGAEQLIILAFGLGSAVLALEHDRPVVAGLLGAAAMICRFDAGLLVGLVGLGLWWRRRAFPWRFALAGLVPVALFALALVSEFGTVVPITLAAKQSGFSAANSYSGQEWEWLHRELPLAGAITLIGLAAWGLVELGWLVRRKGPEVTVLAWLPVLWLAGHEIAYRLLKVPFAPWYQLPLYNGLLLLAAWGALSLALKIRAPAALRSVAAGALLLPILIPSAGFIRASWRRPPDPRWAGYMAAGEYVRDHGGGSVATVEIGYVGWVSTGRILDLMGLVTPEALAARKRGTLPELVAREAPDYVLDATLFGPWTFDDLLRHPPIAERYTEVARFPDERYPGLLVRVLRRRR